MDLEEEVKFVVNVILHPAGYDLGLFGVLNIRPTDQAVFEVAWESRLEDGTRIEYFRDFADPEEAARFFVSKRRERKLGADFEVPITG